MKILSSMDELRLMFSPVENEQYLGDLWNKPEQLNEQLNWVTDEISMDFTSPNVGNLIIKAGYLKGAKHFVIKFSSMFQAIEGKGDFIKRCMLLIGDAHTGVITSLLRDEQETYENESSLLPEIDWVKIQNCLKNTGDKNVWQLQKEGFIAFSEKEVSIPPVIYLPFEGYGDLHLKGAHKNQSDIYVFKIATGFPDNLKRGLLPSQGLMMAFDAKTAAPLLVLRDEGHLTDLRTAIAGRNAAEEMMPVEQLKGIGVLGTGVQARLQIGLLETLYPEQRQLTVWGHTKANTVKYANEMSEKGWQVTIVNSPREVADNSNLIITTTPSEEALLDADDINYSDTLIIAIGADMPGKVELSPALLKKADSILIDSITQGKDHGNAAVAINEKIIDESDLQEFGDFLKNGYRNPEANNKLRLFLSSGIGVQDLQIVQAVLDGSKQ